MTLLSLSGGLMSIDQTVHAYSNYQATGEILIDNISPAVGNPDDLTDVVVAALPGERFDEPAEYRITFDREESVISGRSEDRSKLFVKVPKRVKPWEEDRLYPVRVIIEKKSGERSIFDNVFAYGKPTYQRQYMRIDRVYIENTDPAHINQAEDYAILEGSFTFIEKEGKVLLPTVKFGHADAQIIDPRPEELQAGTGGIVFRRLTVRVPKKIAGTSSDTVDVRVINADGGTAIQRDAFSYPVRNPKIHTKDLRVNRLGAYTFVETTDVEPENLIVAFGKLDETRKQVDISDDGRAVIQIDNAVGDLRIEYQEGSSEGNIKIWYKDYVHLLWTKIQNLTLDEYQNKKIIRIPWKDYPLKERYLLPEERSRLNEELVQLTLDTTGKRKKLTVHRMLGEVIEQDARKEPGGNRIIYFKTPYHGADLDSKITLINADGSHTGGDDKIIFEQEQIRPIIKDIKYSKKGPLGADQQVIRVYETDYDKETTIIIQGQNFREVQSVLLDGTPVRSWSLKEQSAEEIKADLHRVSEKEIDKNKVIRVVTKGGVASSDHAEVPVYLRFVKTKDRFVERPSRYDVPINKTWNIRFSQSLNLSTVNEHNIYIMTAEEPARKIRMIPQAEISDRIVTLRLQEDLSYGKGYYLYIKDLKTPTGKILKENVRMYFETRR